MNLGRAGIFSPIDRGFNDDGIVALAADTSPQWIKATLKLELLDQVRSDGQVLNLRDWGDQLQVCNPLI